MKKRFSQKEESQQEMVLQAKAGVMKCYGDTLTAAILAGGESRRLGRDKAREDVGGKHIIDRVFRVVDRLSDNVMLITSLQRQRLFSDETNNYNVHLDIYPGKGPLGGLYTALKYAATPYVLVVACDMPFLSLTLLRYMVELAIDNDFDAVVPRIDGQIHPLHAIYSTGCISVIEELLRKKMLRMSDLIPLINTRYIEDAEIKPLDSDHRSFININTEDDIVTARELAKVGG